MRPLPAGWWPGHPCKAVEEHRCHRWFFLRGKERESCCQGLAVAGRLSLPGQGLCSATALPGPGPGPDPDPDLDPSPGPPARSRRGARSPLRAAKRRHSSMAHVRLSTGVPSSSCTSWRAPEVGPKQAEAWCGLARYGRGTGGERDGRGEGRAGRGEAGRGSGNRVCWGAGEMKVRTEDPGSSPRALASDGRRWLPFPGRPRPEPLR